MQAVPLVAGFLVSLVLAPMLLRGLAAGGHLRENYRGVALPCPFGLLVVLGVIAGAGLAGTVAIVTTDQGPLTDPSYFVLGVAMLGLVDDVFTGPSRGWRGHLRAVRAGELSTGALKAVGTLALALAVTAPIAAAGHGVIDALLLLLVLVLATNLFNLLDLRPGRATKMFVLVAAACAALAWERDLFASLGLFVGPVVVAGAYDIRERAMLGDAGSNAIGAVAALFLVAALYDGGAGGDTWQLALCVAALAAITVYGEFRSINALVERTPVLKHLDSLGRPQHDA